MLICMKLFKKGPTRKYITNSNAFLNEDDISFYLLGAYMTDGYICDIKHHISFTMTSKDYEWIENIKNIISPNKPIYSNKVYECYKISISDINSMNWLISYGCVPRKSKILKIRKKIPPQYQADFIRGVVDGDGSISSCIYKKVKNNKEYWYDKTTVYICSASKIFLEQIKDLIPLNINCGICTISKSKCNSIIRGKEVIATCDNYRLTFNDSNAKKILNWLYYPGHKLSLLRKKNLALKLM